MDEMNCIMEENDVTGMEETRIDDQPVFEHETVQHTEGFEINTSTTGTVANVAVPELEPTKTDEDIYNPQSLESTNNEDENLLGGGCDACRSMCKYNTGKTWKSSDYGYSD